MRPTIALAMIVKNEEKNLPFILDSVKDCFDTIYITDTGSSDRTVEIAKEYGCEIRTFEWCNDFSAARNASFQDIKEDYICWMDGDDVLQNRDGFISWRDTVLDTADYWAAAYHYASTSNGDPACTFARERVVKNNGKFRWKYFIHEGILPIENAGHIKTGYVQKWSIKHRRTHEDLVKDKGRNLRIFDHNKDKLDARMKFYYGKEFFENGDPKSAIKWLLESVSDPALEGHDRLLGIQYCAQSMLLIDKVSEAINVAMQGIHLDPNRAEFWSVIADCFLKQGKLVESIPFLHSAKNCVFNDQAKSNIAGALFNHKDAYTTYPRNQLARVYANLGDMDKARLEAVDCLEKWPNEESRQILGEVEKALSLQAACAKATNNSDDIVISGLPHGPYEWDYDIYKKRGIGGSETAAVEMAYWLNKLSGRRVLVFNNRTDSRFFDGVEYRPAQGLPNYFADKKPYFHVAWRHNFKLTEAPTYVWSHDIMTMGANNTHYNKILALSQFHSDYLHNIQGIPKEKIRVTRNGIDPTRFGEKVKDRFPVVVWRSSPDRGLERAIRVMEDARLDNPDLQLHVYYGFDNMYKVGAGAEADRIKSVIARHPWIKLTGNVTQSELSTLCSKSMLWLYPTDFTETYCISAIESLCEGIYPIVRRYGGLKDTLKTASLEGMCSMLNSDCYTDKEVALYAKEVVDAVEHKKWEKVSVDPRSYSWESVAQEWLKMFEEDRNASNG